MLRDHGWFSFWARVFHAPHSGHCARWLAWFLGPTFIKVMWRFLLYFFSPVTFSPSHLFKFSLFIFALLVSSFPSTENSWKSRFFHSLCSFLKPVFYQHIRFIFQVLFLLFTNLCLYSILSWFLDCSVAFFPPLGFSCSFWVYFPKKWSITLSCWRVVSSRGRMILNFLRVSRGGFENIGPLMSQTLVQVRPP